MAESLLHMDLVRTIVNYIATITPSFSAQLLDADLPEYGRTPRVIHGYYPDVRYMDREVMVIGEAKTQYDIDNEHTESQLEAYIEEINTYQYQKHIVYCVPFLSFIKVKNKIKRLKQHKSLTEIHFHIIDNFNRVATL